MAMPGVVIRIAAETADAVKGMRDTGKAMGGMGDKTGQAAQHIRTALGPATAAMGALTAGAVVAVNSASELEQSAGALSSVFGPATADMERAAEAANSLGLSTADYNQQAAVMGSLLMSTGSSADEAADATEGLLVNAADMAAMFGGSTSDAVGALSSALRGSYEVLDNYGVKLTAADVSARAAADGSSQAEAAVALLQEGLADIGATGAASREMDTFASQTQQAKASMEDASAEIGAVLLPYLADLAGHLADAAEWAAENADVIQVVATVVGVMAGAIIALNVAMSIYTGIQWAANTALWGFPVIWIVAAIAAVVAAAILLWQNWDWITEKLVAAWEWVKDAFSRVADAISGFFSGLWDDIRSTINRIIDKINDLIGLINRIPAVNIPEIPNVGASAAGLGGASGLRAGARAGGNVTINVTTGIGDPAAIARDIRRILRDDGYRTGWPVAP